jgi:hypothetical protein
MPPPGRRYGLKVMALRIPHGDMPTLAHCVESSDGSIVSIPDLNGTDPKFVDFARSADEPIMHTQIPIARGEDVPCCRSCGLRTALRTRKMRSRGRLLPCWPGP